MSGFPVTKVANMLREVSRNKFISQSLFFIITANVDAHILPYRAGTALLITFRQGLVKNSVIV